MRYLMVLPSPYFPLKRMNIRSDSYLVWETWLFRCVASIITVGGASLASTKAAKRRLKTSALLQRTKRLERVLGGP